MREINIELLTKLEGNFLIVNNQWWNKFEPLYVCISETPYHIVSEESVRKILENKREELNERISMEDFNWLLKDKWISELRTSEQYNNTVVFHLNDKALNYLVFLSKNMALFDVFDLQNTSIYKEITKFLDSFNADWRKNKELGRNAPKLILEVIAEFNELYGDDFEKDFKESNAKTAGAYKKALKYLHQLIESKYEKSRYFFQISINSVKEVFDELVASGDASYYDDDCIERLKDIKEILVVEKGEDILLDF